MDNNAGNSTNTDTLHFGCERSNKTNCLLTGGTLEVTGGTWTSKGPRFHTKGTAITIGADTTVAVEWVVHFAVSETLRGEGTIRTAKGAQSGLRQFVIDGEATDFTGTLNCAASSLVFGSASSGSFGGSATLEKNGEDVMLTIQRAGGVTVAGDVTLGDGVGLDLSAGGALTVGGTFTANGLVPVTLGEGVKDGFALVTLTATAATNETAAQFTGVPEGYSVKAEGSAYVLRWDVSLPAVKPSEPEAGDEATYSTEASNELVAAAEAAQLSEVSQVLLQTKGAESASAPTVTEVNNVLGCFEGVVEATAETQTLTIRYEFGVADIAADDSETPWNGKWQVTAKVEGPTGAAFAEWVTVVAYEVGEDGIIAEDAVPLAKTTIEAGTPVDSVVLRGLVLEGLGTHGVRVRVKATK